MEQDDAGFSGGEFDSGEDCYSDDDGIGIDNPQQEIERNLPIPNECQVCILYSFINFINIDNFRY